MHEENFITHSYKLLKEPITSCTGTDCSLWTQMVHYRIVQYELMDEEFLGILSTYLITAFLYTLNALHYYFKRTVYSIGL